MATTGPKRHHWWPQLQSHHWTESDGLLYVTKADGTWFRTSPTNIGVESELYTRFGPTGEKDRAIEEWFSTVVESPFAEAFEDLVSLKHIQKRPCSVTLSQRRAAEEIGMAVPTYQELVPISDHHREIIGNYAAALLVRSPRYISKLRTYHCETNSTVADTELTNIALTNMLHAYDIYRQAIRRAAFHLSLADCDHEFLFSDAGITAQEPWSQKSMPFDIYFPLTPKLALSILPIPDNDIFKVTFLDRLTNKIVGKQNRLPLQSAQKFVYSRSVPPASFIKKYFGVPAPKAYGHRFVNGRFETKYDRSLDK